MDENLQQSQESTFWVHLPEEEIGQQVINLADKFDNAAEQNGMRNQWIKKWRFYYGRFQNSWQSDTMGLTELGDNGEYLFMASNQFRSLAKTIYNQVVDNAPSFDVSAANTDTSSIQLASLGKNILEYYLKHKNVNDKLKRVVEHSLIFDAGYALIEWDQMEGREYGEYLDPETNRVVYSGDLRVTTPTAFDVIFDTDKDTWDRQDWVIVREWMPRCDLFQRYADKPDLQEAILAAQPKQDAAYKKASRVQLFANAASRELNDDILVYKLYYRKSEIAPQGREVHCLADGTVLFDFELPYSRLPLLRLVPSEIIGTSWGYSPLNDIMGHQEALNCMDSTILTNAYTYGMSLIAVQEGDDINPDVYGRGLAVVKYRDQPPTPISLLRIPQEIFTYRNVLNNEMEILLGISEVSRGVNKSGSSGSNNALMIAQSAQMNGPLQNNWAEFCGHVGTFMLEIIKNFANSERTIAIIGNDTSKSIFTGRDLEGIDKVTVDLGNPLTRTYAGKLQTAQDLLRVNAITKDEFFEVLTSGNIDTALEAGRAELEWVRQENDLLLKGTQITVHPLDNHDQHIAYHRRLLMRKEVRLPQSQEDLSLLQVIQEHITQHEQAIARQQMMQTPPPPMEAPQDGPEGPGPMQQAPQPAEGQGGNPGQPDAVQAGVVSEEAANGNPMPKMPAPATPPQN